MKNLTFPMFAIMLTVLISGCKKDKDENNAFVPGKQEVLYNGNSSMTIQYYDYNPYSGQDVFIEEKTYTYNSQVFIKPPLSSSDITESNPFSMHIYPNRISGMDNEGYLDFSSALIFTVNAGYVLLQYWNITLNGNQLSGTLTDTHSAEATALNMIWAWDDIAGIRMTMPFAMANGTTLTGTISKKSISLIITGQSINTYRRFRWQVNAAVQ
jgi:hypothetical protein